MPLSARASRMSVPRRIEHSGQSAGSFMRASRSSTTSMNSTQSPDDTAKLSNTCREDNPSFSSFAGDFTQASLAKDFTLAARAVGMPDVPPGRLSTSIVQHRMFKNGITLVIILGIIQMGFAVELQEPEFQQAWQIWDVCYTVICTMEMVFMIEAYRLVYFTTRWMLLDFLLAVTSILDTFIFPYAGIPGELSLLRMLRLMRVLRIIKVTKIYPEFTIILEGLIDSFVSMFWIFALLLLVLYAGGICCVTVLGRQSAGFPAYAEASPSELSDFNNFRYFGTLFRSMLTLLSMLLLVEWDIIRQVAEVHVAMVPFFIFLLVLVTFGVLNVIIGIVVEKTTRAMNEPTPGESEREIAEKAELTKELKALFSELDNDGDGYASLSELEDGLDNPRFAAELQSLDLPHNFSMAEFLNMLDSNGNGKLSKHEFASGLVRLIFSTDWQRECLHSMEIGMLHRNVKTLGDDLKTALTRSIAALQSEILEFLRSEVALLNSDTSQRRQKPTFSSVAHTSSNATYCSTDAVAQASQWETLPDDLCAIYGKSHSSGSSREERLHMQLEHSPSSNSVLTTLDGRTISFAQAPSEPTIGIPFSQAPMRENSDGIQCLARLDVDMLAAESGHAERNSQAFVQSVLVSM